MALFTQSYPADLEATLSQRGWNNNSYPTITWVSSSTPGGGERTTSLPSDSVRRDAYGPARPSHSGTPTPWPSPQAHAARQQINLRSTWSVEGHQRRISKCEGWPVCAGARSDQSHLRKCWPPPHRKATCCNRPITCTGEVCLQSQETQGIIRAEFRRRSVHTYTEWCTTSSESW